MKFNEFQNKSLPTLNYIVEVTVIGAIIKQAEPEFRHGRTLNSSQIKYVHDIL